MSENPSFQEIVRRRLDRRGFLCGLASTSSLAFLPGFPGGTGAGDDAPARETSAASGSALSFESVPPSTDDVLHVPRGYEVDVLLRWGDALFPDLPSFDLDQQSGASQARRFGFNCDYVAYLPLTPGDSERGLLVVNHEFIDRTEMFRDCDPRGPTPEQFAVERAAHGLTVSAIGRDAEGRWEPKPRAQFNRRITADTPFRLAGPVAGHELVRTGADREGLTVLGTLANCAGGRTPWGTVLSGEENFPDYFAHGARGARNRVHSSQRRYGLGRGASAYGWECCDERFDVALEPNEFHRFGWIVEIDPYDPESVPVKRTALGRMRHEGATTALADDGRVVVYMGDDTVDEFLYKFVSDRAFEPGNRAANRDLLDSGTLYAARFDEDGTGRWLPLRAEGPLSGWGRVGILVHTRLAASALGATPMDRPEDVQVNPVNQRVYAVLTKNPEREHPDHGPNPRAHNRHGHVVEIDEDRGNLGSETFTWQVFLLCGDPVGDRVFYAGAPAADLDPLSCPDNLAFAPNGTMWIATDGQPRTFGTNDGLYAVATFGPERGRTRRFLTGPRGSEICGPEFTPDGRTLFVSVQHPGRGHGLDDPEQGSRWPDGDFPRPSVVAVRRSDGGTIGA